MGSIFSQLRDKLSKKYIDLLEQEYFEIRKSFNIEDETKVGIHCGRFCEIISSLLCFQELEQNENLNQINFNKNITKLENSSKSTPKKELYGLLVPRVLRSIYTIRNKKKIAHIKNINPQKIDIKYLKIAVDWIISQLVIIYCDLQDEDVIEFFDKISYEEHSKVEKFENGELLFKNRNMPLSEKILIVLLDNYNDKRISRTEIYNSIKPKNKSYISTYINRLKHRNLIHETDIGIKLTKWGISEAQKILRRIEFN